MMNSITHVEKPWGYEKIWAKTDNVGKILFIKNNYNITKLKKRLYMFKMVF